MSLSELRACARAPPHQEFAFTESMKNRSGWASCGHSLSRPLAILRFTADPLRYLPGQTTDTDGLLPRSLRSLLSAARGMMRSRGAVLVEGLHAIGRNGWAHRPPRWKGKRPAPPAQIEVPRCLAEQVGQRPAAVWAVHREGIANHRKSLSGWRARSHRANPRLNPERLPGRLYCKDMKRGRRDLGEGHKRRGLGPPIPALRL